MNQHAIWLIDHAEAIWSAVGPLVGVGVGAYIANRNQRKRWIADNKKKEYQELVTSLTSAFNSMLRRSKLRTAPSEAELLHLMALEQNALITMSDRIFIEHEVREMKILDRWQALLTRFNSDGDTKTMGNSVGDIKANLVHAALQLLR